MPDVQRGSRIIGKRCADDLDQAAWIEINTKGDLPIHFFVARDIAAKNGWFDEFEKKILMGISRLTALQIQTHSDHVKCEADGPNGAGKYTGWISVYTKWRWQPLLSTNPIYDSHDAAVEAMQGIVKSISEISFEDVFKSEIDMPGFDGDERTFDMSNDLGDD